MPDAPPPALPHLPPFDVPALLASRGVTARRLRLAAGKVAFVQGAAANSVFYLQDGVVKLSVLSSAGKEAVVGILGPGDFFGEGSLAGQPTRMGTATAVSPTIALRIQTPQMLALLHANAAFAERFLAHMLARNIRIEEDLVDQLFNSSEKRLARVLLLLSRYGQEHDAQRVIPHLSQEVLAEMVGATRSRVNLFMNKFRRLGFIEYNGSLKVHNSLVSVALRD